ncbi:MAG TPA: hypothetical protein VGK31_04185 [Thermoanaerobaculia bacterium]
MRFGEDSIAIDASATSPPGAAPRSRKRWRGRIHSAMCGETRIALPRNVIG